MNWQETKTRLREHGIKNLPEHWEYRINLSGANLREADLSGANLSRANLSRADLSGADLCEANLREADLSGANLSRADLSGANLSGANLREADLRGANLCGANLSGANLREADLSGADLYNTVLEDKTKEKRNILRNVSHKNGGLILYRTKTSQHVGSNIYEVGKTYKAPVLSSCHVTDCHPGIYGLSRDEYVRQYGGEPCVKIYVPYGEWHFVSKNKGFRARRVRVLADVDFSIEDA